MTRSRGWDLIGCLALAAACSSARAQQPQQMVPAHAGYAYPAGGRQGTTVEVRVGGQNLVGATGAHVSGDGVVATVSGYTRPLNQREVQQLQEKLQQARQKLIEARVPLRGAIDNPMVFARVAKEAGLTAEEIRGLLEFRRNRLDPKRQPNPQIAEIVTLQIKIDPRAAPGMRELRLITPRGLSNAIHFVVGDEPEYDEGNEDAKLPMEAGEVPVVVNGQITPGDVDRFIFHARKGQHLVARVSARSLMPYLADAVPGWFQAAVTISDSKGRELAYADHYRFEQDPVLFFTAPQEGALTIEIRDAVYRGREDFVYRVEIGEMPFITSIYPLGGRPGTSTVQLAGYNLTRRSLTISAQAPGPASVEVSVGRGTSNRLPFAVDAVSTVEYSAGQLLSLPVVVNGRVAKPGEAHEVRIKGKSGEKIVAEVVARRLGSPLDSTLELRDAQGKVVAFNDDADDKGAGLTTHQADSYLAATLPSSGTYVLTLRDAQSKGGPDYGYRLRVSHPQPGFDLRVTPSGVSARPGMTVAVTVFVLRRDGFAGDVLLSLVGAPEGVQLGGGLIPATQNSVPITVTVPASMRGEFVKLRLEGKAQVSGKEVSRLAVAADDMMQAFAYHHLVPTDEWLLAVTNGAVNRFVLSPPTEVAKLPAGGIVRIQLAGVAGRAAGRLQLTLREAPEGISLQGVTPGPQGVTIAFRADAAKIKPGWRGNLIVDAWFIQDATNPQGKPVQRRVPVTTLPAIPIEIVKS